MKKSTKLLSVLLAFVMVISMFAATMASAAAPYKPTYSDEVTEEDVELLLDDVNTVLSAKLLNGSVIESLYKLLPGLTLPVFGSPYGVGGADTVEFYTKGTASMTAPDKYAETTELNKERFADLAKYTKDGTKIDADVKDDEGNVTEEGTFTKFFKEHPIEVNSMEEFRNEMLNFVDTVFESDLRIFMMLDMLVLKHPLADIQNGFDALCEGLGVDQQGHKAKECDVLGTAEQKQLAVDMTKNVVNALFPDLSNNVVGMIQNVVKKDSGAKVYQGIALIGSAVQKMAKDLPTYLPDIGETLQSVSDVINGLPTIGEAENETDPQRLDIEGLVNFLIGTLLGDNSPLDITFVDREEGDGKAPKGLLGISTESQIMPMTAIVSLKFRHMQLDRVAEAESTADVVKIVYDYLYDNLICYRETNTLIKMAIQTGILENALKMQLPEDVKNEILTALETDREPLADHLLRLVAEMDEVHHHRHLEAVAAKAPTCTADGTVAYYHCPYCGLDFATDDIYAAKETALTSVVAPATGHQSLTKVEAKAATCTENGNVEYYRCDDCGLAFKSEADAAANNAFDPTVKAAGHQYGEWKEENGKQVRTCSVCGATETKDAAAPSNPSQPDKTLPQIPVTGAAVTGFSAISLLAAAAFVTMAVRSKKDRDE